MENKLRKLFDYQRFEQNPKLNKYINEAHVSSFSRLSDEQLKQVAGGRGNAPNKPQKPKK